MFLLDLISSVKKSEAVDEFVDPNTGQRNTGQKEKLSVTFQSFRFREMGAVHWGQTKTNALKPAEEFSVPNTIFSLAPEMKDFIGGI